ncbi:MAG: hypothetical protein H0T97_10665 [Actinobacteria bacterium]|nr:hypothetical protein [Actinomycetota bacterium]
MSVLTTDQKGAIAESAIVYVAIKRGIGVYKPVHEGGRYDLILEIGSSLLRVQCKSASKRGDVVAVRCYSCRRGREGMIVRKYTTDEVDAIAAYCPETESCYLLPTSLCCGRRLVHLRVAPSRNNQRAGINWADEFEFDARLDALLGP